MTSKSEEGSGCGREGCNIKSKNSKKNTIIILCVILILLPSVVAGEIDWEAELFSVMPEILMADTKDSVNELLISY